MGVIPKQYRPIRHDHVGSMEWLPDRTHATECYCRECGQAWKLIAGGGRWVAVAPVGDRFDPWADDGTF